MSTEMTQTAQASAPAERPAESTRGVAVYRPLADIRDVVAIGVFQEQKVRRL